METQEKSDGEPHIIYQKQQSLGVSIDEQYNQQHSVLESRGSDKTVDWDKVNIALNWDLSDVKNFIVFPSHQQGFC